jgi:1-deoxy-D-xylulose-5-phosphate synthase
VGTGLLARRVLEGDGSVAILAVGKLLVDAQRAAERLVAQGVAATVWDVRSCAPLDPVMILDAARHGAVVTVEDGIREGGIGMSIADRVHEAAKAAGAPGPRVEVLGIPDRFIPQGPADRILAQLGLDADGIVAAARSLLDANA